MDKQDSKFPSAFIKLYPFEKIVSCSLQDFEGTTTWNKPFSAKMLPDFP